MIKVIIDGLYRGGNLVVMIRVLNTIHFVQLDQVEVEILIGEEPWFRSWWGKSLTRIILSVWFEQKVDNILWAPPPAVAEASL